MSRRRGEPATGGRTDRPGNILHPKRAIQPEKDIRPEKKASKEFCPLARCVWTAPDGVCRWPGNNCPRRQERLAAEARIWEVRQAARRMAGLRKLAETLKGEERIARIAEVREAGMGRLSCTKADGFTQKEGAAGQSRAPVDRAAGKHRGGKDVKKSENGPGRDAHTTGTERDRADGRAGLISCPERR